MTAARVADLQRPTQGGWYGPRLASQVSLREVSAETRVPSSSSAVVHAESDEEWGRPCLLEEGSGF